MEVNAKFMGGAVLRLDGITKSFDGIPVLSGIDASFERGIVTAILGPNGAGKTTLFNLCSGFLWADRGIVSFGNQDITRWSPDRIARSGLVRTFQTPRIFFNLTVLENLLLPLHKSSAESLSYGLNLFRRHSDGPERAEASLVLDQFELAGLANAQAYELSWGQLKLLQLARTTLLNPELLLLDEPVAGLFPSLKTRVMRFIRALATGGKTVLVIEHNLDTVREVAERVLVLHRGNVMADGPTSVLNQPQMKDLFLGNANNS